MRIKQIASAAVFAAVFLLKGLDAQVTTTPTAGIKEHDWRLHALVGATVFTEPGRSIENATVIVRNGTIAAVGADISPPDGSRIWDLSGRVMYAGFIDAYTQIGLPEGMRPVPVDDSEEEEEPPPKPEKTPGPEGGSRSWNERIRPERAMADYFDLEPREHALHRGLGFAAALVVPGRGIISGESALVNLAPHKSNDTIINPAVAQHIHLVRSGERNRVYPRSLMGKIALIRQTLYDAAWYGSAQETYSADPINRERPVYNASLEAMLPILSGDRRVFFDSGDELGYARISNILREFNLSATILGNGYEYRVLDTLKTFEEPVILPVNFPKAPDVDLPSGALEISLAQLQHWELAPSNAAFLEAADIPFCFTAYGLEKPANEFWKRVRSAVTRGLSESAALAALTTQPAATLGVSETLGRISEGGVANLVVASGNLFADADANVITVWVDGHPYPVEAEALIDPRGAWAIVWHGGDGPVRWDISGALIKLRAKSGDMSYDVRIEGEKLLLFPAASLFGSGSGTAPLAAYVNGDRMNGSGELPDGSSVRFSANRFVPDEESAESTDEQDKEKTPPQLVFDRYPAGAYGREGPPTRPNGLLIKNATIWTSAESGILEGSDMLVMAGEIIEVGKSLAGPEYATVIDATGKHITAGLIDSHSHVAISSGLNESTAAVTLEVRVKDVIDPTDIGIYRQLAGGLTVANMLHGSANPMGGQNAVIKLRWGEDATGLIFDEAPPGVKMALGENVKQSNWGSAANGRYPQTRMGVEQIIRATLLEAREYERDWIEHKTGGRVPRPRRNLRLDAALEVLNRDRIVHVHSYRQDEILMFVRLVEEFGLSVAAFQHVLEGYKTADSIRSIGAGASTFPDWWAYKFEVYDAIPQNGAFLHRQGVVASFHSDDNEIARRMNTEAAKAVRYGDLSAEEALAFVTINPARQLGIEQWVGSLEPGKDADFVIWNGDPLSTFTSADQTWIDGRRYFDRQEDHEARAAILKDRRRLIQRILAEQLDENGGGESGEPGSDPPESAPTGFFPNSAESEPESA